MPTYGPGLTRCRRRVVERARVDSLPADCRQVHAPDAVAARRLLLRRRLEAIESLRDAHVGEARLRERRDKLCFQQSTGDSTGPEIDVLACVFPQLHAEHNVGDLNTATWFQHAPDLGDCRSLLSHEIQDAV